MGITINLTKAKAITKNRLRRDRRPLLAAQDILFMQAQEAGASATNIVKEKNLQFVFFNDGDNKSTSMKKIGETGGIYYQNKPSIEELVNKVSFVQGKGGGGDGPENNMEALIKGVGMADPYKELVMVADNHAPVKDLELLTVRSGCQEDGITPELIICKKNNKLLDLCIKTYIQYMNEKTPYSYWGWSIVHIMRENIKKILNNKITLNQHIYLDSDNKKYKLIDEILCDDSYNHKVMYNNEIVLYNRYENYNKDTHEF